MKNLLLCLLFLGASKASAETEESILLKWRSCLLPVESFSFEADTISTFDRGLDVTSTPIKRKEKGGVDLISIVYYQTQLGFFEQGLRSYTTSWNGARYYEVDRLSIGAKELSYDLIKGPGCVNIYNTRRGGVPQISRIWLDLDNVTYLNSFAKHADKVVFDEAGNKISMGKSVSIYLSDDRKSVKKIERYVGDAAKGAVLFYTCEINKTKSLGDKILPEDVTITNYLDGEISSKTNYVIRYNEESLNQLTPKDVSVVIQGGAWVNDGVTGKRYQKDGSVPY